MTRLWPAVSLLPSLGPPRAVSCGASLLIIMDVSVRLQGKFYLVIEELSQLFRSLVPIQLWYKYIMGDESANSYFLGGALIVLYSLCKVG